MPNANVTGLAPTQENEMDATRQDAIKWIREKMCDFKNPVYPPPSGWMWAESGDALVLAPIFTMTDQGEEICSVEVNAAPSSLTLN